MTRPRRRRPRPRVTLLAITMLLLILAACNSASGVATLDGADDEASTSPSPSAGSEDPEEAMFAFADCMREQGIDMPDPVIRRVDGSGSDSFGADRQTAPPNQGRNFDPNSEEFQAAEDACRQHLDSMGTLEPGEGLQLDPEQEEAMLKFTECMREHGIDMPDFGGGAVRIGPGEGEGEEDLPDFDPMSDEFQAAQEACREHLDELSPDLEVRS